MSYFTLLRAEFRRLLAQLGQTPIAPGAAFYAHGPAVLREHLRQHIAQVKTREAKHSH